MNDLRERVRCIGHLRGMRIDADRSTYEQMPRSNGPVTAGDYDRQAQRRPADPAVNGDGGQPALVEIRSMPNRLARAWDGTLDRTSRAPRMCISGPDSRRPPTHNGPAEAQDPPAGTAEVVAPAPKRRRSLLAPLRRFVVSLLL